MQLNQPLKAIVLSISLLVSSSVISCNVSAAEAESKLVTVKQAKLENISPVVWLPGNVTSRLNARLSAEQSGKLLWVLDVGAEVKKGQEIARIDTQELEFQLAERQTELRQQQANVVYLQKQQKRLNELLNNKSTARSELDITQRDLSVAKEALASLKIQVKRTELSIEKASINAPFDGIINRRMAQQGEFINAGSLLVQLVNPKSLDVSVAAPLSVAPYLSVGEKMLVKIKNDLVSLPVRTWTPAGEQSSRTFNVLLDASSLNLMSGNSVSVSLPKDDANVFTMVPRDALILRERETFVVTVDKEKSAHKVDVIVGRGVGDWISVNGKVAAGDAVVVRGGERLEDGQKVHYQEEIEAKLAVIN